MSGIIMNSAYPSSGSFNSAYSVMSAKKQECPSLKKKKRHCIFTSQESPSEPSHCRHFTALTLSPSNRASSSLTMFEAAPVTLSGQHRRLPGIQSMHTQGQHANFKGSLRQPQLK